MVKVNFVQFSVDFRVKFYCRFVVPNEKPSPRRYAAGVLYNGYLYTFGGLAANKSPLNDFYQLDYGISPKIHLNFH
jgi:hypothetical protein